MLTLARASARLSCPPGNAVGRLMIVAIVAGVLTACGGMGEAQVPVPAAPTQVASPAASHIASPTASPSAVAATVADCKSWTGAAAATNASSAAVQHALVVVGALNLRAGPGTDCDRVDSLGFGARVAVHGPPVKRGGYTWQYLRGPDRAGFAIVDALQPVPDEPPTTVPILMYHHIGDEVDRYTVSAGELTQQLRWLKKRGYVSITPTDLHRALFFGLPLPAKPIMLTIDDGNPSTIEFARIVEQEGFRGVYFLNDISRLSPDQIAELAAQGEICGHTATHADLSVLSTEGQHQEIAGNKLWLESIIGRQVVCFAYPFGAYNEETDDIVAKAGYLIAFDAWHTPASLIDFDRWHLPRIEVNGGLTIDDFRFVLANGS
ncbi:MAG: hypothetical protein QOF73_1492 [Thermomicrobiales bacterium]|nr:hypothetical protein [Thermomicrobiales bacterium]